MRLPCKNVSLQAFFIVVEGLVAENGFQAADPPRQGSVRAHQVHTEGRLDPLLRDDRGCAAHARFRLLGKLNNRDGLLPHRIRQAQAAQPAGTATGTGRLSRVFRERPPKQSGLNPGSLSGPVTMFDRNSQADIGPAEHWFDLQPMVSFACCKLISPYGQSEITGPFRNFRPWRWRLVSCISI